MDREIRRIKRILERGEGKEYFQLRTVYAAHIAEIYEKVRSGEIRDWGALIKSNISFFAWKPNLQEVARYVTESYVLPYYRCTLEDLPIQLKHDRTLLKFGISLVMNGKYTSREFFLAGFPEMEGSPHWHRARWPESRFRRLSEEVRREYSKFRRDYMFRYVLHCDSREDVIAALNDEMKVKAAIKKERIRVTYKKGEYNEKTTLFELIRDLDGDIYIIDPWELDGQLPKYTMVNREGSPNKHNIARYFQWVGQQGYEMPLNIKRAPSGAQKIPHYNHVVTQTGLSSLELRQIAGLPVDPWEIEMNVATGTWIGTEEGVKIENIKRYLRWLGENNMFPKSATVMDNAPHFTGMYIQTGLPFSEIRRLYNEVMNNN